MKLTQQRILEELGHIAFARGTDYLAVRGDQLVIRDTDSLPEGAGAAISSVERSEQGLKVKLYDKLKALELLGKYLGIFDGTPEREQDSGLLQASLEVSGKEMVIDDLPEIEQAAGPGNDLVEPAGTQGV